MKRCPVCGSSRYDEIRTKEGKLIKARCKRCEYKYDINIIRDKLNTKEGLTDFEKEALENTLERHKESFKKLGEK